MSSLQENASIENLQIKVAEVTAVMQENVQFALKNTDAIENIETKSELLVSSSDTFRKKAVEIKYKLCLTHWKRILLCLLFIGLICLFIYLIARY